MLMALRKKMRAKLLAIIQETPAAEVGGGHDYIAGLDLLEEVLVHILHAVLGQLIRVGDIKIACRYDSVGIDISAVFVDFAF
jgi:hypothetical protein